MNQSIEIKYDNITIADKYLNGYDYDRVKNAIWSIHHMVEKIKKNSTHLQWGYNNLHFLYEFSQRASFKDDEMTVLVLPLGETFNTLSTTKKDLPKCGFNLSNKNNQFALSYKHSDFSDVIFGLKFFVDVCTKHASEKYAETFFNSGDISIVFKDADIQKKEKAIQDEKDYANTTVGALSGNRFPFLSDANKAFIIAFDKKMNDCGYNYGSNTSWMPTAGGQGKGVIVYAKSGAKNRSPFARVHIYENDTLMLRMYFKDIDKHRTYIENAPQHIKNAFVFEGGNCNKVDGVGCVQGCKSMKLYTINGTKYVKCCHAPGHFYHLSVEQLSDYMALLAEFYPKMFQNEPNNKGNSDEI